MEQMIRNRVVHYNEVELLNKEATNALATGYTICGEWDQSIENLKATMETIKATVSSEYVSSSLEQALNNAKVSLHVPIIHLMVIFIR